MRAGSTDPRQGAQQAGSAAPASIGATGSSGMSAEAHAGFAHVAQLLGEQGVVDPAGQGHLTQTLVEFFEGRMVRYHRAADGAVLLQRPLL
jgi:hypothetical protein